jgi:hypothetical protein
MFAQSATTVENVCRAGLDRALAAPVRALQLQQEQVEGSNCDVRHTGATDA